MLITLYAGLIACLAGPAVACVQADKEALYPRYHFWMGQMRLSPILEGTRPPRPPRFLRPCSTDVQRLCGATSRFLVSVSNSSSSAAAAAAAAERGAACCCPLLLVSGTAPCCWSLVLPPAAGLWYCPLLLVSGTASCRWSLVLPPRDILYIDAANAASIRCLWVSYMVPKLSQTETGSGHHGVQSASFAPSPAGGCKCGTCKKIHVWPEHGLLPLTVGRCVPLWH